MILKELIRTLSELDDQGENDHYNIMVMDRDNGELMTPTQIVVEGDTDTVWFMVEDF